MKISILKLRTFYLQMKINSKFIRLKFHDWIGKRGLKVHVSFKIRTYNSLVGINIVTKLILRWDLLRTVRTSYNCLGRCDVITSYKSDPMDG